MNQLIARSGLLDDFFKDVAPGFFVKPLHGEGLPAQIRVDVKETPEAYQLSAEIPGVNKEDIHVHIDGNTVSLRAEIKQQDSQTDNGKLLRSERYFGAVSRSFQLPVDLQHHGACQVRKRHPESHAAQEGRQRQPAAGGGVIRGANCRAVGARGLW